MSKYAHCATVRVFLSASVFFCLLLASCSSPRASQPSRPSHATYNYAIFTGAPTGPTHSGDQLTATWKSVGGPDSDEAAPTPVILEIFLLGPFSSPAAVKDKGSLRSCFHIPGNAIYLLGHNPIHTNDWTSSTYTSILVLPHDLPTGYYGFVDVAASEQHGCLWGEEATFIEAA